MRSAGPGALLAVAVAAAIVQAAFAERQPYERYQSIVDRQMFGPLPPGFDPTKSPAEVSKSGGSSEKELTKEQEKVKSAIRFSVINVTPGGETAIGFTDNSDPKVPKHYYLKVGESRDGWEVKEADAKAATMTIAKDGIEVSLSLGGDSSKDGKTQAAAASAASASRRSPMLNTLGSRRRARLEREEADQREAAKREEERAAAAKAREEEERARREEEKAQRDAEREEQRRQLEQIREELRKTREERQAKDSESNGGNEHASDAE